MAESRRAPLRSWAVGNLLALGLLWLWALAAYPSLPSSIPLHFDAAGRPDRVVPTTPDAWFLLPGVAALLTLFLTGCAWFVSYLVRAHPTWINTPNKRRFLALSAEQRLLTLWPVIRVLLGLPLFLIALFGALEFSMLRVASGVWPRLPPWIPVLGIAALALWLAAGVAGVYLRARSDPG